MSWDNVGSNHCSMDGTPIKQTKERRIKMDEEYDFGFSFATEEELTIVKENNEKIQKLRDMIMPLLTNLKKNPEKDVIKWEGAARIKSIDAFIKKMNKLVDES
jgi:hypothetical protein